MNINDYTPTHWDLCCALKAQDYVSDVGVQERCSYKPKAVVVGSLYGDYLFTKAGDGDTVVALCGNHIRYVNRHGKINTNAGVTVTNPTTTTKENIMSLDLTNMDPDELAHRVQWTTEHSRAYAEALLEGRPFTIQETADGPLYIETCPEDEEHLDCHINIMETLHESAGEGCCHYEECDHAYAVLCVNHTPAPEEPVTLVETCPCDPKDGSETYHCSCDGTQVEMVEPKANDYFIIAGTGARELVLNTELQNKVLHKVMETLEAAKAKYGDRLRVLSGGGEGFDYVLASAAHKVGVPFTLVIPHATYPEYYWRDHSLTRTNRMRLWDTMKGAAHKVITVCDTLYVNGRLSHFIRNEWMVDHCNMLWVWDPMSKGTKSTWEYADKKGVKHYQVKVS
jgi:hypothetical protein